jgi:hypothetical protein
MPTQSAKIAPSVQSVQSVQRRLEGIPVRRTLTMEALVILRPGRLTPAGIRVFSTLHRQNGHLVTI